MQTITDIPQGYDPRESLSIQPAAHHAEFLAVFVDRQQPTIRVEVNPDDIALHARLHSIPFVGSLIVEQGSVEGIESPH